MRGVGVRSISSKSFITSSALMVGGVERTAGNEAHHSCGLFSASVMIVCIGFGCTEIGGENKYLRWRCCDHGSGSTAWK